MILMTIYRLPSQSAAVLTDDNYIVLAADYANSANGTDFSSLPLLPNAGDKFVPGTEWQRKNHSAAVAFAAQQRWDALFGCGDEILPYMKSQEIVAACNALDAANESQWNNYKETANA